VSRDPTEDFSPLYEYSERFTAEERRRGLFTSAIPYSLIAKIIRFKGADQLNCGEKDNLFRILECTYWTHLHKCPTNNKTPSRAFNKKNGVACANAWLSKEIEAAIREGAETIVCLGNDVQSWCRKNRSIINELEVIELPHPSNQNNR